MMKRRLKNASLPTWLSPHSFRVAVITDRLEQGVSLEEVQHLAGHADRMRISPDIIGIIHDFGVKSLTPPADPPVL